MNSNDLYPRMRLRDLRTSEVVGYIMDGAKVSETSEECYSVALSVEKIKEICPDFASYMDYADGLIELNVLAYKNKYIIEDYIGNVDSEFRDGADVPFDMISLDKASIWGYICPLNRLIPFDDEFSLRRALQGG